jgi:pimeloyl-ACP methyl ester carboxylesterase
MATLAGTTRKITDVIVAQTRRLLENRDGEFSQSDASQVAELRSVMDQVEKRAFDPGRRLGNLSAARLYSWLDYDETATAGSLSVPAFVAQGERDWQVSMENYEGWLDALPAETTRGERYPALNHFFQPGVGASLNTEYRFFDAVAAALVADLAAWIETTS